jgi:hypothetical protein
VQAHRIAVAIVFAVLAAWLLIGSLQSAPPIAHESFEPLKITDLYIAIFSGLLVLVTCGLVWVGWRQVSDARVLQRAYVGVEPKGIRSNTEGYLIGHVTFKNVGHLPASDFRWFLEITPSNNDRWIPPAVGDASLREGGVLPIGTGIRRGSPPIGPPSEGFLYVWGKVAYTDGFERTRFATFCHRYNTVIREIPSGGGYRIRAKHARYHDHGNNAD